jgi:hypothetical protein
MNGLTCQNAELKAKKYREKPSKDAWKIGV